MIIPQVIINGLLVGGVYVLASIGLSVIYGVLKIVNFAHGAFLMVGMFIAYWSFKLLGLDPVLAIIIAAPLLALLGVATYTAVIKPILSEVHYIQMFIMFGVLLVLENLANILFTVDARTLTTVYSDLVVRAGPLVMSVPRLLAFVVGGIATAALYGFLRFTYAGKAIRAVSQDARAARLMGINNERIYVQAMAIGMVCTAVSGAVLVTYYPVYPSVGGGFLLICFIVVILGGPGNIIGAIVSGLMVGLVESLSGYFISPSMSPLVYFLIFILALLIRPYGLFGERAGL